MSPTFGSLFAGIGGIDLGLERAGWECQWQVENDPYCTKVLEKHWPDVQRFGDVKEATELPPVDLIAGGFPCQPVSHAGKRKGEADERWLWPEFARIIRLVRPQIVLVENVSGLLARPEWMGAVLEELAESGYDAEWDCIPAAAVGAPHLRYRVFIVAHRECPGRNGLHERQQSGHMEANTEGGGTDGPGGTATEDHCEEVQGQGTESSDEDMAESTSIGCESGKPRAVGQGRQGRIGLENSGRDVADTECDGRKQGAEMLRPGTEQSVFAVGYGTIDGIERCRREQSARQWTTEPDVGRVAHGVPARVDRLKGLGNAVVPQVAEWLGKRILETWRSS